VAILLVEKAQGVHQLVDGDADLLQAAGRLQIQLLTAAQTTEDAPTTRVFTSNHDVVLLDGPELKAYTGPCMEFLKESCRHTNDFF